MRSHEHHCIEKSLAIWLFVQQIPWDKNKKIGNNICLWRVSTSNSQFPLQKVSYVISISNDDVIMFWFHSNIEFCAEQNWLTLICLGRMYMIDYILTGICIIVIDYIGIGTLLFSVIVMYCSKIFVSERDIIISCVHETVYIKLWLRVDLHKRCWYACRY